MQAMLDQTRTQSNPRDWWLLGLPFPLSKIVGVRYTRPVRILKLEPDAPSACTWFMARVDVGWPSQWLTFTEDPVAGFQVTDRNFIPARLAASGVSDMIRKIGMTKI